MMNKRSGQLEGSENADKPAEKQAPWHNLPVSAVLEELQADENGLSDKEATERLNKYGPNRLPESKSKPAIVRFLLQFHNVLIYVLLAAAVLTASFDHWLDTWVILGVVLINAVIGFVQEGKAEKALDSIRKMLSLYATVLRNGKRQEIEADQLVPGDIVLLESGDKIPADLRLFTQRNLRVEESALTGESVAVEKITDPSDKDAVPGDRKCIAFSGTSVVYGRAKGIVVETGSSTELGKIEKMMTEVEKITTPLLRQIDGFGKALSVAILLITGLFFVIGYFFRGYELAEIIMAVISLAVAAIPEGLPAIMTITLAIGVQAMAKRNAIIRRLPSVETLGSVTVICSDKTGTLTKNEMTARAVITSQGTYDIEGAGYSPEGRINQNGKEADPEKDSILFDLAKVVRTCSDADIYNENGTWTMEGDPTDGAMVTLGHKAGFGSMNLKRIDHIPFESEYQYMATLNDSDEKRFIFMKGAPERLLELCRVQKTENGETKINKEYWLEKMEELAEKGQRLIAAAYTEVAPDMDQIDHKDLEEDMIFLGLAGIIDPPRPEAVESIKTCKTAGIKVKMITGDHLITAKAIGRELGIGDGVKAISGSELESMDDEQLQKAAVEYDVFARTSPEHKLRLVTALQKEGMICAMTGDGVNDAPALKRADVGIAMGIKGTEVTKDASEMVLADDNFASIAQAVEQGRTIYDNLRKAILFILPTNGAESLVIMVAVLLGIVLPITPVQILWVNMVTAVTLALALSFEPTEQGVMQRPPRKPDSPILGGYFIWRIGFVSVLIGGMTLGIYYILKQNGYDIDTARTIAVNTLAAGQLFYLFNCRKMNMPAIGTGFFDNRIAFIAAGILILLQLVFTYAPFMNLWFGTSPIATLYWIFPLAAGVSVFLLVELEKFMIGQARLQKQKKLNSK